jgi:hypothetical protein
MGVAKRLGVYLRFQRYNWNDAYIVHSGLYATVAAMQPIATTVFKIAKPVFVIDGFTCGTLDPEDLPRMTLITVYTEAEWAATR